MKSIAFINLLCVLAYCGTAFFIVREVAQTYERTHAICPGSLEAGDYYTPEEADHE